MGNAKGIAIKFLHNGRVRWEYFPKGDIADAATARKWVALEYGIPGKDILQTVENLDNYAQLVERHGQK